MHRCTILLFSIAIAVVFCFIASACVANPADDLVHGRGLAKKGDYSGAIPVLSKVVDSDRKLAPQALHTMANCHRERQKWAEAISCYSKLLAEYSGSVAPDREIKTWIMDCRLANNEPEKALSLREDLLNDYGQDAWKLYYILGRRYVWQHKHVDAIAEFEKAVELGRAVKDTPDILDAKVRLLECYLVQKQWDKAETFAQRLMSEHPDRVYEWQYAVGRCHLGRERFGPAIASFEKAAELSPRGAKILRTLFKSLLDCYSEAGDITKAISLSQKLVTDYPQESAWHWELGRFYLFDLQYDKASSCFRQVVVLSRRRWEVRSAQISLGECLFKLGRGEEALQSLQEYYSDKLQLWDEYLLVKGAVLFHGGQDYSACIAAVQELVDQSAKGKRSGLVSTAKEVMLQASLKLAESHFRAKDYGRALEAYQAISEQEGIPVDTRADAAYQMVMCYSNLKMKNAAQRLALRISSEYPDTSAGMRARGLLRLWSEEH